MIETQPEQHTLTRKPEWQKMPIVPRKKGTPRNWMTYRWARRNAVLHPLTKRERRLIIQAGNKRGSR